MVNIKAWLAITGLALLSAAFALRARTAALPDQRIYDIVMAGGRVMDPESGLDAVRNVGQLVEGVFPGRPTRAPLSK
jgi:N-acyl-D-glutamate deacylase